MVNWIAAIGIVAAFVAIIQRLRLVGHCKSAARIASESFTIIRSRELPDEAKEEALQKNTPRLFIAALKIILAGVLAVGVPVGVLYLADSADLVSFDEVLALSISMPFLGACLLAWLLFWLAGKYTKPAKSQQYSPADRMLHRLAFNTRTAQLGVASVEDQMFRAALEKISSERPVFVTGMPRSGTTLVLECLANLPDFASHTCRDMPFVFIPCLWS